MPPKCDIGRDAQAEKEDRPEAKVNEGLCGHGVDVVEARSKEC